ncbi:MAG: sialate O-acetylesterase [bacterium]
MNWMRKVAFVIIIFIPLFQCGQKIAGTQYQLYYLGGQSNMDGFGFTRELPEELNATDEGVMIFHGNSALDRAEIDGKGVWVEFRPGHGTGFSSDGETNHYSDRFGVEITFARRMRELNPKAHIAIIKYSRGVTSIDSAAAGNFGCWEPDFHSANGINQYDHFLATVRNAMAVKDINGDGKPDKLIPAGILWMQGESDGAFTEAIAQKYESNLNRLMHLIRSAFRSDNMPVAIGRISDSGQVEDGLVWEYGDIIREAQAAFVKKDRKAALVVSTDEYGYSDPWHYDSQGYIDLGKKFAEALFEISK